MAVLLLPLLFIATMAWDPDAARNFTAICEGRGYAVETHSVTTTDGYILTLFRIPGKIGEIHFLPKPPVFL
jgi:hypothetical protein